MSIPYTIIHTNKRKTISLQIKPDGSVVVRAPKRVGEAEIRKLVKSKESWIAKNVAKVKARKPKAKEYRDGEKFLFLGKEYPFFITNEYRSRIYFENAFYLSLHMVHKVKTLLEQWYKDKALEVLRQRVELFTNKMGVNFKRIGVRNSKTRWGSCSSTGSINFSWRLVMAPLEVVDYVVVHELAHLLQHNHSTKFWKVVEQDCPNYKKCKEWLNSHGHELVV